DSHEECALRWRHDLVAVLDLGRRSALGAVGSNDLEGLFIEECADRLAVDSRRRRRAVAGSRKQLAEANSSVVCIDTPRDVLVERSDACAPGDIVELEP